MWDLSVQRRDPKLRPQQISQFATFGRAALYCGMFLYLRSWALEGSAGGANPHGFWNLTFFYYNFSKKGCFLSFERKNEITLFLAPLGKTFSATSEKIHYCSLLEKILPTHMLAITAFGSLSRIHEHRWEMGLRPIWKPKALWCLKDPALWPWNDEVHTILSLRY